MERFHPDCQFCQLCFHEQYPEALHTPLIFEDDKFIAVIDDHRKGYKERYLIVTKFGHFSREDLPEGEWDSLVETAVALAEARVWNTKEKYVIDTVMSDNSHAHIQACFRN